MERHNPMGQMNPPEAFDNLERRLPENCVEYMLFVIDSSLEGRKLLSSLEAVRKSAVQLANSLTKDYIWQRGGFDLKLGKDNGLLFLHGTTDYSDSVEDEWLIVYILREVTKSFPSLWIRVFDSDGEFLLVEAANVLPKWINPDIDANRVWMHNDQLMLVPIDDRDGKPGNLGLSKAVEILKTQPKSLTHSSVVQGEAFYRLEKYPDHIAASLHYSRVTIPRKLAFILYSVPKAVAPAVESFYLRSPLAIKPLMTATTKTASQAIIFPPTDLVTVSIKFTKVLFSQLKSQPFSPVPPVWAHVLGPAEKAAASKSATPEEKKTLARLETGMKLAVGFDLLSRDAASRDSRVGREVAIRLEDLAEDGDSTLPTNQQINAWPHQDRDDDEGWMDIDFQDFEKELGGRKVATASPRTDQQKGTGFGDATAQADLRKMVQRFESFLNDDDAGMDGVEAEDDEDDSDWDSNSEDEDKEVSFDENEFARMMREMMGMPSADLQAKSTAERKSGRGNEGILDAEDGDMIDGGSARDNEGEEIRKLMQQMETELNEHGALKLDPTPKKLKALKGKGQDPNPPISNSPLKAKGKDVGAVTTNEDEESDDQEVDIDYNLAKNLLESFKSQGGLAGPAGNILGMMGMQLPRDEDEAEGKRDGNT